MDLFNLPTAYACIGTLLYTLDREERSRSVRAVRVHPGCFFVAYVGSIRIGADVHIASNCAFYPYNHGFAPGILIADQPLTSRGDIVLEDDVNLGFGVIVLEGVTIGKRRHRRCRKCRRARHSAGSDRDGSARARAQNVFPYPAESEMGSCASFVPMTPHHMCAFRRQRR